jgi:hypothetical protein
MGFGTPLASSTRYETLGAGTAFGTAVTASATVNTLGTAATLGTTSFEYDGIFVSIYAPSNSQSLLQIIANTGGSDQVIANFLPVPHEGGGGLYQGTSGLIPIRIPAGAVVKARVQSQTTVAVVNVFVVGFQGDSRLSTGFRGLACCTDITTSDATNGVTLSGTTQTAWVQIQASTAQRIAGLYWSFGPRGLTPTNTPMLLQVGWGTSGNERVLFSVGLSPSLLPVVQGPYPCDFPIGTRLAVRMQCAAATTQTISIMLHGLEA